MRDIVPAKLDVFMTMLHSSYYDLHQSGQDNE